MQVLTETMGQIACALSLFLQYCAACSPSCPWAANDFPGLETSDHRQARPKSIFPITRGETPSISAIAVWALGVTVAWKALAPNS